MSTATPNDRHAPDHPEQNESRWVAQFDDKHERNEVTFRPADVEPDQIRTAWITVEVGHGTIVNVGDYQ